MKLYRVHGYRKEYIQPKITAYQTDENHYFKTLEKALEYINEFIDKENIWCIELYNGFMPIKIIARSAY